VAEHRACHGCLDGCTRESAVHCTICVNQAWPCDAQRYAEALCDLRAHLAACYQSATRGACTHLTDALNRIDAVLTDE